MTLVTHEKQVLIILICWCGPDRTRFFAAVKTVKFATFFFLQNLTTLMLHKKEEQASLFMISVT